jgi:hypothetical protein
MALLGVGIKDPEGLASCSLTLFLSWDTFAIVFPTLVIMAPQIPEEDHCGHYFETFTQEITSDCGCLETPRENVKGNASCIISKFKFAQTPTCLSLGLIMIGIVGARLFVNCMSQDESHYHHLEGENGGLEDAVTVIENIFAADRQSMEECGLQPGEFKILDKAIISQYSDKDEQILRAETVVYCHIEKVSEKFNNCPNAIIEKLFASGWVELEKVDSPLESRCELNREKLGMPETRIASIYKAFILVKCLVEGKHLYYTGGSRADSRFANPQAFGAKPALGFR